MLSYSNCGLRAFGDSPMAVHRRAAWEFYAVLEGRISPLFENELPNERCERTLWLFAPSAPHGWTGREGENARVAVFHFLPVPKELERRVDGFGGLRMQLTVEECDRLREMALSVTRRLLEPDSLTELHSERTLLELTLMVLERGELFSCSGQICDASLPAEVVEAERSSLEESTLSSSAKVTAAEKWFHANLAMRPTTEDVAGACGLSTAHLRRLFWRIRGAGPKAVFHRIRMDVAKQLLAHTDRTLDDIASESGFASASAFCQAFKELTGMTPTVWRHNAYLQFCDHRPSALRRDVEKSLAGSVLPGGSVLAAAGR